METNHKILSKMWEKPACEGVKKRIYDRFGYKQRTVNDILRNPSYKDQGVILSLISAFRQCESDLIAEKNKQHLINLNLSDKYSNNINQ